MSNDLDSSQDCHSVRPNLDINCKSYQQTKKAAVSKDVLSILISVQTISRRQVTASKERVMYLPYCVCLYPDTGMSYRVLCVCISLTALTRVTVLFDCLIHCPVIGHSYVPTILCVSVPRYWHVLQGSLCL